MEDNPQQIAFASITYFPKWYHGSLRSISHTDKIRGDLAIEFLQKASRLGYQVVVVDGNSSKSFKNALSALTNITVIKRRSHKRSPGKRQAFQAASKLPNVKVIISTEAEKTSLIDYVHEIVKPLLENTIDIVIPKRENSFFKSNYPDYMYESEVEGNRLYNELLKLHNLLPENTEPLDMFFGPRAFRNDKKILMLFLQKFSFKIANTIFYPVVLALQKKLRIGSVEIPFVYPTLQKENESVGARDHFVEKRNAQRLGLLVELMYFLNYMQTQKRRYKK
jgi:hypothetical protein